MIKDIKARKEALNLMCSIVIGLKGDEKEAAIKNLDIIGMLIQVLIYEDNAFMAKTELHTLEHCFYKDSDELYKLQADDEERVPDFNSLNLQLLEYFFSCDGENTILFLRDRFIQNEDIY
jgi:hypothetical protein